MHVSLRFIEFMKNWTEVSKPEFMDLAFTSERSIEDELDRESKSDIFTILVSYVIMFIYIAIALGHIRNCGTLLVSFSQKYYHYSYYIKVNF